MIRIGNVVICENTQQVSAPDGKLATLLVNPMVELRLPMIPCLYSFVVSFCVGGFEENEEIKQIKAEIVGPDHAILSTLELPELTTRPADAVNLVVCFDFRNVLLKDEGLYTAKITVNDMTRTDCFGIKKGLIK